VDGELKIFSGSSNRGLAARIARTLGRPLGEARAEHFPDGEADIQILENVRGADVFVVQSTCAPVDRNLMQLLIMIDALRRASAGRVTALIPYFGYARQEKKSTGREPITAKLVANILEAAGVSRIVTLDLHAPAVQGFFDIPVDHLLAAPLLADAIDRMGLQNPVIVSPDAGGVTRAHDFSQRVASAPLAVVFKNRTAADRIEHLQIVVHRKPRQTMFVRQRQRRPHGLRPRHGHDVGPGRHDLARDAVAKFDHVGDHRRVVGVDRAFTRAGLHGIQDGGILRIGRPPGLLFRRAQQLLEESGHWKEGRIDHPRDEGESFRQRLRISLCQDARQDARQA
jgi:hypothetical protein